MAKPQPGEYAGFFSRYIRIPQSDDARILLEESLLPLQYFLQSIPEEKATYAYAEGKWTVKQVLQHLIDTERVFAYRAMAISRGETQSLPGFDENIYAENATAENRSIESLTEEYVTVRKSTILLYKYLTNEGLLRIGTASNHPINANSFAFIIVGHELHHRGIINERYLT
jgi:uncharacterized damage-inducible protein DinB